MDNTFIIIVIAIIVVNWSIRKAKKHLKLAKLSLNLMALSLEFVPRKSTEPNDVIIKLTKDNEYLRSQVNDSITLIDSYKSSSKKQKWTFILCILMMAFLILLLIWASSKSKS